MLCALRGPTVFHLSSMYCVLSVLYVLCMLYAIWSLPLFLLSGKEGCRCCKPRFTRRGRRKSARLSCRARRVHYGSTFATECTGVRSYFPTYLARISPKDSEVSLGTWAGKEPKDRELMASGGEPPGHNWSRSGSLLNCCKRANGIRQRTISIWIWEWERRRPPLMCLLSCPMMKDRTERGRRDREFPISGPVLPFSLRVLGRMGSCSQEMLRLCKRKIKYANMHRIAT